MNKDTIVQFVCFETTLSTNLFVAQWNQFNKSSNSELDITLQIAEKNGVNKFITQHRFKNDEIPFVFTKPKKSSRVPEISVREKQAGGYTLIQSERNEEAHKGESKIFVFFTDAPFDYDIYRQLCSKAKLNIYEAYYQNSKYGSILEIFCKQKESIELVEQLKQNTIAEIGIYNECVMQTA